MKPTIFSHLTALFLAALMTSSCAAPPPVAPQKEKERNFSFTRTWITNVGSMGWPSARECELAATLLEKEKNCVGNSCRFAVEISSDYMATCAQDMPDQARNDAARLNDSLAARATEAPLECTRTPAVLLDYMCNVENQCAERALIWATRCGESVGSPLLVRTLEKHVRESLGNAVFTLDTTSCKTLGDGFVQANSCDDAFECKEISKNLEPFLARCGTSSGTDPSLLSIEQGMAIYSIYEKAEQPRNIPLAAKLAHWPTDHPLVVAEGKAKIVKFCGARPQDTGALIEARAGCKNGVVELFTIQKDDQGAHMLKRVKVPFPNAAIAELLMPWLVNRAEQTAATNLATSEMNAAVESLAFDLEKNANWRNATKTFLARIDQIAWTHIPKEELRTIWAAHDKSLVALFTKIGGAKGREVSARTAQRDLEAYLNRSRSFPFADLDPSATVAIGTHQRGAALPVAPALPLSMKAYLAGLVPLEHKLSKYTLSGEERSSREAQVYAIEDKCGDALGDRDHAQSDVSRCAFRTGECSTELVSMNSAKVRDAHTKWQAAWLEAEMASTLGNNLPAPVCPLW